MLKLNHTKMKSTHAQAAAEIRKALKSEFPQVKFKVRSESFSMGDAVRITWDDGPTENAVREFTDKYQIGHFDGMTDMYEYSNRQEGVPQVKYVQTSRTMTDKLKDQLYKKAGKEWHDFESMSDWQKSELIYREFFSSIDYSKGIREEQDTAEQDKKMMVGEVVMSYKTNSSTDDHKFKIKDSKDAAIYARRIYDPGQISYRESMYMISLNIDNQVLGWYRVSEGGTSGTFADPKTVFQFGLLANASAFILVHNHPSGNKKASQADKNLTKKIEQGGKLMEIIMLDHIILTEDGYSSYADGDWA